MDKKRKVRSGAVAKVPEIVQPIWNVCRRLGMWASSRKGPPLLIGICLGVILTDTLLDYPRRCQPVLPIVVDVILSGDSGKNVHISDLPPLILPPPLSVNDEDYEPVLIMDGNKKINPDSTNAKRPIRPRYYASELGMHETLFVGVSSSARSFPILAVAVNKTSAHYLPRLSFYVSSVPDDIWSTLQNLSMNIVRSSDTSSQHMHPMLMLRHIVNTHLKTFDWFFLAPDSTYIRGRELLEFVRRRSVGRPVYMGIPLVDNAFGFCDFSAGILLSQSAMIGIEENWQFCTETMEPNVLHDFSVSIGKCIHHVFGLRCDSSAEESGFESFYLSEPKTLDSQDTTADLVDSEKRLQSALTIHPLSESNHYYRLHLELSQKKISENDQVFQDLQEDIVKQSPHTPGGGADLQWPIGINAPVIPHNRFDVIEWTYFNDSHRLRPDDFRVAVPLIGAYRKSVQEVIEFAKKAIDERYVKQDSKIVGAIQVQNGYYRFDPTRGIEYLLDLSYQTENTGKTQYLTKKVRLLRSLGQMEQINLPFVTEKSRIWLTVTIGPADIPSALAFLKAFTKVHLEAQDNVYIMAVLLYGPGDPGKESPKDVFLQFRSEAQEVDKRYTKTLGSRIGFLNIRNPLTAPPSEFAVLDLLTRKLNKDSIVFRCNVNLVPSVDLLNRVRLSTIPGTQVYFPIPFTQYNPSLVHRTPPYPESFDIKRHLGHYDADSVQFASYSAGDYLAARKNEADTWPLVTADRDLAREYPRPNRDGQVYDLYTLFLSTDLHVYRGVEPNLKVKFAMLNCDPDSQLVQGLRERCERQLLNSLAGKQQLALFIANRGQLLKNDLSEAQTSTADFEAGSSAARPDRSNLLSVFKWA